MNRDNTGNDENRIIIGITGGTCSGKGIAVENLMEELGNENIIVIHQDSYYKPLPHDSDPLTYNFDHPDAIDWDLLGNTLEELSKGKSTEIPIYDFTRHLRKSEKIKVKPKKVIIIEGILVLHDENIRNMMNYKFYIDADSDLRLLRRIKRDMESRGRSLTSVITQYENTVKKSHSKFIEPCKTYADFIIKNNDDTNFTGIYKLAKFIKAYLFQ